jgi:signal transduction histidine kinase
MEISLRKRLSYRQARLTILVAVGLGILFSSVEFFLDLSREIGRLEANVQQTLDVVAPGAAAAARATDRNAARSITGALLRNPPFHIFRAEIVDDYGIRIASQSRPQERSRLDWLVDRTFGPSRTFRYPLFPRDRAAVIQRVDAKPADALDSAALPPSLGSLVVSLDHHVVMNNFVRRWLIQFSSEVFRMSLLAAALVWAFHRLITRPLGRMAWHYSSINLDQPGDCRFPVPETHREDELGLLADSVNHAMERLAGNAENQRQSNFHLQRVMDERRRAEAALHRKEEQLEQSRHLESAGHLAVGVAQEFNHLLTGIQGYARMIRDAAPPGQTGTDAGEILRSCARAQDLTAELLALGSRQLLAPAALNPNALLAEMEEPLRAAAPGIQLELDPAPTVWNIHADRRMLEKALLHLVASAAEAMGGQGLIRLRTANAEHPPGRDTLPAGRWVCLSVEDDGPVIPRESLPRVFEPFSAVRGPNRRREGMRLATAHGIIRQSGGHMAVTSHRARGTRFDLLLPMTPEPAVPAAGPAAVEHTSPGTETLLVVEPDTALRSLLARMLALLGGIGYRVLTAGEEAEALQAAAGVRVDLLLSELDLPGGAAPDLHRQLCTAGHDCAALYTVGAGGESSTRSAFGLRPESVLVKPYTQDTLAQRLREILDSRTAVETSPP